jgi:amidohydrolase
MRRRRPNLPRPFGPHQRQAQFQENASVTYNEPSLVEETLPTFRRVVGDKNVLALKPFMPAEDFAYYQRALPGFYFFLGVGNRAKGITAGWHTAEYDVDEESLVVGVNLMANALLDHLERHAGDKPAAAPSPR